jgi:DNA repair protein RadC
MRTAGLTDTELLRRLLDIPQSSIVGDTVYEIVNSLTDERASLLGEICCRYGEKRKREGERFNSSLEIYNHFRIRLQNQMQESFICVYLENKHRIILEKEITVGTLNQSLVHPREIFAPAVQLRAAAIILIHNHPSGDPQPSTQDIEITKRLSDVGKIVGINVLDHLIIGDSYYSFIEEETMPN